MTNETSNRDGFAPTVNWDESCMRTQIEHGADIGSAGRAILADMHGEVVPLAAECCAECQTIHDGVETPGGDGDTATALFENCGTINTEGDLGLCGE